MRTKPYLDVGYTLSEENIEVIPETRAYVKTDQFYTQLIFKTFNPIVKSFRSRYASHKNGSLLLLKDDHNASSSLD
jgi:hypothetical protein